MKDKYGFKVKRVTLEARESLNSLVAYTNAAGVKVRSINTKEEFWSIIEAIYKIKIDRRLDDSKALSMANMEISSLPRSLRRKMQKEARGSSQAAIRKRINGRLEQENEAFYVRGKSFHPSKAQKQEFYNSWEWLTLRKKVLNEFGAVCQCCGAHPGGRTAGGERVSIHVDHIKPLHNYWSLRLNRENLQILCAECNKGAGAWDETDHRPPEAPDEWIVDDEVGSSIIEQLTDRTTGRLN